MQSFFILFNRYLSERAKGQKMFVAGLSFPSTAVQQLTFGSLGDATATGTRSSLPHPSRSSPTPTCPKLRTPSFSTSSLSSSSTEDSELPWVASDPRVSSRFARG
jgi:hypothetical protein